jgi:hypothetical protein
MPYELCHSKRTTRIASGRLNPQLFEGTFALKPAIADAVECYPTGQAEPPKSGLAVCRARHPQHDLLADDLDRPSEIHLLLRQL